MKCASYMSYLVHSASEEAQIPSHGPKQKKKGPKSCQGKSKADPEEQTQKISPDPREHQKDEQAESQAQTRRTAKVEGRVESEIKDNKRKISP